MKPANELLQTIRTMKQPAEREEDGILAFHHLRVGTQRSIARIEQIDQGLGVVIACITTATARRFEHRKIRLTIRTLLMGGMDPDELSKLKVGTVLKLHTYRGFKGTTEYTITKEA